MSDTVTLEEGLRAFRESMAVAGKALPERTTPYFFADKAPYKSPLDRTVVEGRAAHREHMQRHNVVEAGDMKLGGQQVERSPMDNARNDIKRAIAELS